MAKEQFSDEDFAKSISIGDQLIFDKQAIKTLRFDFVWDGYISLDVCAFMLGKDGLIHDQADLVYFNSRIRWKTKKNFSDPQFNPLEGEVRTWATDSENFKYPREWMDATFPISSDGSVIGPFYDMDDTECSEKIYVRLDVVDKQKYASIVFAVAAEQNYAIQTFKDLNNSIVKIYDADTKELLAEYKLLQQFNDNDIVCFGKIIYDSNSKLWSFEAMADGSKGGLEYLANEVFS